MATAKAIFFLGIALLSCSLIGASRGLENRRSLFLPILNNDTKVFDVTKFGAVADGETDNVDVSLIYFITFVDSTNSLRTLSITTCIYGHI